MAWCPDRQTRKAWSYHFASLSNVDKNFCVAASESSGWWNVSTKVVMVALTCSTLEEDIESDDISVAECTMLTSIDPVSC
jgi:hypothetical protein